MSDQSIRYILQPVEGEVLKLGPPAAGEFILKVDPRQAGGALTVGVQTLAPGARIPLHRNLQHDEVWFVHKGQGRSIVEDRTMTVGPGVTMHIPRNTWCSLRNTGTGALQITWMAAPAGLEQFFRELAQLGTAADVAALASLGQRYGIEFRDEGEVQRTSAPSGPAREHRTHRRHRRGGRGRGQGGGQPASGVPGIAQPEAAPLPVQEHAQPPGPSPSGTQERQGPSPRPAGQGRRRRHRRRGAPQTAAASAPPSPRTQRPPQPAADRPRDRGRPQHRRGRVKEVYMGGRWVPVVGEGPVIAPGRERPMRRSGSPGHHDDDSPSGPLTVSL